ncbi:MAG TPA: hypothetical protein VGP63_05565, partial [Planctomycetaceae bacterium]|nr:hypothetical protein [Planctomycetaceae bacterium]
MEILCGLVGFAFVLVCVAVIGHMLWLAGAAVFGSSPPPSRPAYCPACAAQLPPGPSRCLACGTPINTAIPFRGTLDDELDVTRRQLRRLMLSHKIPDATWEQVVEAIRADVRERALGMSRPEPPLEIVEIEEPVAAEPVPEFDPTPVMAPIAAISAVDAEHSTSEPMRANAYVAAMPPAQLPPAEATSARGDRPQESNWRSGVAGFLQAFMEEKNIRWGELVSGLLIVGSSVGLVISLWATLKETIPYFPVAVFLTATCAMHGA